MSDIDKDALQAAVKAFRKRDNWYEVSVLEDILTTVISAYEAALWKPIETAQRPESSFIWILLADHTDNEYIVGYWHSGNQQFEDDYGASINDAGFTATHWRPLPKPPGDDE